MVRLTFLVLLYWLTSCFNSPLAKDKLKIVYEWKQIEFDYSSDKEREEAIKTGTFNKGQIQPLDVDVYYPQSGPEIVFITCLRFNYGVPATLATISSKERDGNPIITPYPNWEWHTNVEMCKKNRIVSVYRIFIDKCDRLWVMDIGQNGSSVICPPQILAFNLKTNALDRQYEIPSDQLLDTSFQGTILAETSSCEETFVYVADVDGYALIVYDYKNNKSWMIQDKTFYADKDYSNFSVAGTEFSFMDGIIGLALSPGAESEKKLYYHAMASETENWVYTKYLNNESSASELSKAHGFHTFPKTRGDQSSVEAMDRNGNLFFGLLHKILIAAWNTNETYDESNFQIIGDNKETMQFPGGMKVINDDKGEESLWVFCSRFQIILTGKELNSSETNFRIFSAPIKELLS